MRGWQVLVVMAMVACGSDGGSPGTPGGTTGSNGTTGGGGNGGGNGSTGGSTSSQCEVLVENDLPDPLSLMRDDEHYCEGQPLYNPDIPTASAHWYGEMTIDDCGIVTGQEVGLLFPNPKWEDAGAVDCMVVWDVDGVLDAPTGGADLGMTVTLTRNFADSDCPEDPYDEPQVAEEHYNIHLDGDTARFYFDGGTEPFAEGWGNESHLNWFFDSCPLF